MSERYEEAAYEAEQQRQRADRLEAALQEARAALDAMKRRGAPVDRDLEAALAREDEGDG